MDNYSLQEVCQLDYVTQFKSNLRHIQGPQNVVADVLSRSDIQFISDSDISHENITVKERKDATIHQAICNSTSASQNVCGHTRLCDMSLKLLRPYVPASL